jgi:hypothetical protein
MKEELDAYLVKKYPKIFRNRNSSAMESSMCWGFQCGDGWFNILNMLCASIEGHIKGLHQTNEFNQRMLDKIKAGEQAPDWIQASYDKGTLVILPIPDVTASEVKEKFGTLRFSVQGFDDSIRGMIRVAESMSAVTCEECGKPGYRRDGGWIKTLCDEHAAAQNKKQGDDEPLKIGDHLYILDVGGYIKVEITNLISQEEIIGLRINDKYQNDDTFSEDKDAQQKEYYSAKYIETDMISYWNAEKFDG